MIAIKLLCEKMQSSSVYLQIPTHVVNVFNVLHLKWKGAAHVSSRRWQPAGRRKRGWTREG